MFILQAVDERKQKLLKDFQTNKKSNSFVDRRFGEADADMSLEEKMFMRFQREKVKKAKNLSMYNLDSEETHVLTHKGTALGEANMVDDADLMSSDDEDRLGREVVNNLHFGGGFVKKSGENEIEQKPHSKSKSEILQEIVMKSKLHKMQKREAKDAQESQREDIDKQFEELIASSAVEFNPLGKYNRRSDKDNVLSDNKNDEFADYDTYFGAMQYESKAQPTDRTKSAEELAVDARERLERLENERLKRMNQTEENDADLSIVPKNKKRHVNDDEVDEFGDNYGWNNKDDQGQSGSENQSDDVDSEDEEEDDEEEEDEDSDEGDEENESNDEEDDSELDNADSDAIDEGSDDGVDEDEDQDEDDDDEEYDSAEEAEYDKKLLELLKIKEKEEKQKKKDNSNIKDSNSNIPIKPVAEEVEKIKGKRVKVEPKNTLGIEDDSININMPHSIKCPADILEFEDLIEKYVLNVTVDFPELVNRILIWNSVHLPGAQGNLNRPLMHNFTDVLVKFFVKVGNDLKNKEQKFSMNEVIYFKNFRRFILIFL
jgi:nucleolar protein 14